MVVQYARFMRYFPPAAVIPVIGLEHAVTAEDDRYPLGCGSPRGIPVRRLPHAVEMDPIERAGSHDRIDGWEEPWIPTPPSPGPARSMSDDRGAFRRCQRISARAEDRHLVPGQREVTGEFLDRRREAGAAAGFVFFSYQQNAHVSWTAAMVRIVPGPRAKGSRSAAAASSPWAQPGVPRDNRLVENIGE